MDRSPLGAGLTECVCDIAVGPKLLQYVTKVMQQSMQLLFVLLKTGAHSHVLLQVCLLFSPSCYKLKELK